MNILIQVVVYTYIFISLGYIPKSEIAGSYDNSVFNLVRLYQAIFQSSSSILHSHQQCMRVPSCPHPHQQMLLSVFLIIANLAGVTWYLFVFLIYISHSVFMANTADHLFMLIGHLYAFPEEMSIQILCLIFNWVVF